MVKISEFRSVAVGIVLFAGLPMASMATTINISAVCAPYGGTLVVGVPVGNTVSCVSGSDRATASVSINSPSNVGVSVSTGNSPPPFYTPSGTSASGSYSAVYSVIVTGDPSTNFNYSLGGTLIPCLSAGWTPTNGDGSVAAAFGPVTWLGPFQAGSSCGTYGQSLASDRIAFSFDSPMVFTLRLRASTTVGSAGASFDGILAFDIYGKPIPSADITITELPEPGTWTGGAAALALILIRRRRVG